MASDVIRIRNAEGAVSVREVSFSQLCEYLPVVPESLPVAEQRAMRQVIRSFFRGERSIEGPLGNVKLVDRTHLPGFKPMYLPE